MEKEKFDIRKWRRTYHHRMKWLSERGVQEKDVMWHEDDEREYYIEIDEDGFKTKVYLPDSIFLPSIPHSYHDR